MAHDAITRQYDVEKNLVTLTCEEGKGGYRPGLITFHAKKGKSIDLQKIRDSITATRLSGGTGMSVDYLEITVLGAVEIRDKETLLSVSGSALQFSLADAPSAKGKLQKLRDALAQGEKVTSVVGRVEGWTGVFPVVLKGLANAPAVQTLQVIDFEIGKK